jgi:hypothetical protein
MGNPFRDDRRYPGNRFVTQFRVLSAPIHDANGKLPVSSLMRRTIMKRIFVTLMVSVLIATPVAAQETLRCGSKIVSVGMTSDEVKKYCGSPSSRKVEEHDVRSGNRVVGKTQMNIWTYNRASGQNAAVLEFDVDKLMSIKFVRK